MFHDQQPASWRRLPATARTIAQSAAAGVAAARDRDAAALDRAIEPLAIADPAGLILGTVTRLLLERAHPDGLDGDDVRAVLEGCVRTAGQWQPAIDPHVVLVVLAGALGVLDADADEDGPSPPDPAVLARHAILLIEQLAAGTAQPVEPLLTAALAEIERTELHD